MATGGLNLLQSQWLDVKTTLKTPKEKGSKGNQHTIALTDITNLSYKDVVSPRADFKGAIYQLLIGVIQTSFAPKGRKEWLAYWHNPPTATDLQKVFEPYVSAFALFPEDNAPAFMQDFDLPEGERKAVSALCIEAPGGKTIKDNQDHFAKRGTINQLSPIQAAIALFTLQINAPSGGVGHRVSLRGGGPLTTLVLPQADTEFDTLWHRVWLNILTQEEMQELTGNTEKTALSDIFPWMAATRISKTKDNDTYPQTANPMQMYWSMPRRVRLELSDKASEECHEEMSLCDISGEPTQQIVTNFRMQNYGVNYAGSWMHPLTPYVVEQGKEPYSIKAQPGGLGYRHWLGLLIDSKVNKTERKPALVVSVYKRSRSRWLKEMGTVEPRLWAFGFDMDNMKARCWYESTYPIFNFDDQEQQDDIQEVTQLMVNAASDVLRTLKTSLKSAWFTRPKEAKGDFSYIDANFWGVTEAMFFESLGQILEALKHDDEEQISKLRKQWKGTLKITAIELFDQYALSRGNSNGDMKAVITAKHGKGGLEHYLNGSKALKIL